VRVQDLYCSYPDYTIDVAAVQAAPEKAQLVLLLLLHPIQCCSSTRTTKTVPR